MRFGLCTNMVATGADGTGFERASKLKQLGYDYVELPLAEMMALSDSQRAQLVRTLSKLDLRCEVCNNFFPASVRLTGPAMREEAVLSHAARALAFAADLGAEVVVFGSGVAKNVPPGFPLDAAFAQLVTLLRLLEPVADQYGIVLALEPARNPDCNIINTFEQAHLWALEAETKTTGLMIDYFHMNWEREAPSVLTRYPAWLKHIHIACPNKPGIGARTAPALDDGWDYGAFTSAVKQCGYGGRISIEAYMKDFRRDANGSLQFLASIFGA